LTEALVKGKSTFFSRPEWQAASQKGDSYDGLLDILFQIPTCLQRCGEVTSVLEGLSRKEILPGLVGDLLDRFEKTDGALLSWYRRLEQEAEPEPLYWEDRAPLSNRPLSTQDDPQLLGLFSGTIRFSNGYRFELVMLYWFGRLRLYTSLVRMCQKLQSHRPCLEDVENVDSINATILCFLSRRDIEDTSSHLARHVCQTVAFCLQSTSGAQGFQFMLACLWAAQEYFRLRSASQYSWCQQVFWLMAKKGYGAGKAAANVTTFI
jgi:hypothetical protein